MIKTELLAKRFLLLGGSIVDYMKSLNIDSSKTNRAKLAKEYGIENYFGTAAKRPLLARHVPNLGYKATTWTGKGNK